MVSETTLISIPTNGLAASWNHLSSATCWSRLSVLGWNSLTHFSIAALRSTDGGPAAAEPLPAPASGCFLPQPPAIRRPATAIAAAYHGLRNNDDRVCMVVYPRP